MFTLLLLISIIWAVIMIKKMFTADKRNDEQQALVDKQIAELPDINICAKEMTSTQKALNLWPSDKDLLKIFRYNHNTKKLYMQMKDGRSVDCGLNELKVEFAKMGTLCVEIHRNGFLFSFYQYDYVFTDKEWEVILSTLSLAGKTEGIWVLGDSYKNMSKAKTVMKIIKLLS